MDKKLLLSLRQRAHKLKPVVMIGSNGLTEAVQKETNLALESHELIKIKISSEDKPSRQEMINEICKVQDANVIQQIGHTVIIYRKSED
jgi:RNA-binding protein